MAVTRKKKVWTVVAAGVVVVVLILGSRFLPWGEWLGFINQWTSSQGIISVMIFCAVYILAVLLLLPSSVFTMSAGVTYGLLGGTLLSVVSATLAAAIAFVISRHSGHASVQRWLNRHRKLKALDHAISEHEWKIVFLSRLAPFVPFGPVNYSLGLSNVHFWKYITATAAGILPGTFLYAYAGYAGFAFFGDEKPHSTSHYALIASGLVLVIILALVLGRIAKRALDDFDKRTT